MRPKNGSGCILCVSVLTALDDEGFLSCKSYSEGGEKVTNEIFWRMIAGNTARAIKPRTTRNRGLPREHPATSSSLSASLPLSLSLVILRRCVNPHFDTLQESGRLTHIE
jgi:hypothetical protein